jgi:DNA-binding IclR family transcriptional regulator
MSESTANIKSRTKTGASRKSYASPAVTQAAQILYCLANNSASQMSLKDIRTSTGISGSKAHNILEALVNTRLVSRGRDGKGYSLGPGLISLSRKLREDFIPSRIAEPILNDLTQKTGYSSVFCVIFDDQAFVAMQKEAEVNLRLSMPIGQSYPISFGAHGMAIGGFFPDAKLKSIVEDPKLNFFNTENRTNIERLKEELSQCRKDGFAIDSRESNQGVKVIAAPVLDSGNYPIGFVEIFALVDMENASKLALLVKKAGKTLSKMMSTE